MALDRRTPTLITDPGGIADTALATDIDAEIHALWNVSAIYLTGVSGTNTILGAASPALDAYATGMRFLLVPAVTNTGPVTLNVDSKGAKAVKDAAGVALLGRELVAGRLYYLVYDGTNFRMLAPIGSVILTSLRADFTGADVNTAQPVFAAAQDTITLEENTWYEIEAEYWITRAAGTTSHTTGILFGGTLAYTWTIWVEVTNPTGNVLANVQLILTTAASLLTLTAANTSATENILIKIKGRMLALTNGTFIPQFQYSVAPGGVPTIKRDTTFKLTKIGLNTLVSVGAVA